ncbi:hypothetical protein [Amycolatopsis sp. NPDC052450]|uniref:hypothetical protein n=1 Tax=Amycolatopsis sp. NPDC052450 TaxID=3363937 RepID=UPI0037CA312D
MDAARGDYPSMARLALALYEAGHSPREVIRECYGVGFPSEFFIVADAAPKLMFQYTVRPWMLARPLDRGGPLQTDAPMDSLDGKVLARDPDLVPLGWCLGEDEGTDDEQGLANQILCYRRSELEVGRSTIFGIDFSADQEDPITPRGDSLLAALLKHHVANADWVRWERRRTAGHSGGGLDDEDVQVANQYVTIIEELLRQVA